MFTIRRKTCIQRMSILYKTEQTIQFRKPKPIITFPNIHYTSTLFDIKNHKFWSQINNLSYGKYENNIYPLVEHIVHHITSKVFDYYKENNPRYLVKGDTTQYIAKMEKYETYDKDVSDTLFYHQIKCWLEYIFLIWWDNCDIVVDDKYLNMK